MSYIGILVTYICKQLYSGEVHGYLPFHRSK